MVNSSNSVLPKELTSSSSEVEQDRELKSPFPVLHGIPLLYCVSLSLVFIVLAAPLLVSIFSTEVVLSFFGRIKMIC